MGLIPPFHIPLTERFADGTRQSEHRRFIGESGGVWRRGVHTLTPLSESGSRSRVKPSSRILN